MKEQINTNNYRKSRLLQVVDTQLQYDQYRQVLDALEVQVEQSYMKRFVSIKRPIVRAWILMMDYTSEYKKQRSAKQDHQQRQAYQKTPLQPWRREACLSKSLVPCLWIRTLYCHPTLFTKTPSIHIIQETCTFITFPTHCVIPTIYTPSYIHCFFKKRDQTRLCMIYNHFFFQWMICLLVMITYYDYKLLHRLRKHWAY